jgi:hypothetical protein
VSAPLFVGDGLVARTLRVAPSDVAWVRYVVEAHDGLANIHIEKGGVVTLVTTREQVPRLDALIEDLERELDVQR